MVTYPLIFLCLLLALACFVLFRRLRESWSAYDAAHEQWKRERQDVVLRRDLAVEAIDTFMTPARIAIRTIEDEVEMATGHSTHASALACLYGDVCNARSPFDVVTRATAREFAVAGIEVAPLPMNIGQALTLAIDMDTKARQQDRYLHSVTRLCQLDGREVHLVAETLSRLLHRRGGDAAAVRTRLRAVLDMWEKWEGHVGSESYVEQFLESEMKRACHFG